MNRNKIKDTILYGLIIVLILFLIFGAWKSNKDRRELEKIIQEVQNYTGAGPHDLSLIGKLNNIVTHTDSSVVILPLNPVNGFITRVINYGTGSITINTQSPNTIDTIGPCIELTNYLDKSTFL